ncbi:hypothetical protein ASG49_15215 [Marmoricola sp. Leaf446]|uniref:HNH endonuclease signature motif containing protein n=1 Tax=Marmoricola sp. Leaf446 TaxID=1736379 RepID=UPI0006FB6859|nr:HNH endonuclease signature motif containing protein [Marmoricola sp. Leaf446]KQT89159.1 hypothetical protein ASG49_15215 [Marmoricola sp. Leaf446]
MSSSGGETTTAHPVAGFVHRLRSRLDDLDRPTARPVWAMTPAEQRHVLTELAVAQAQLDSLRLAVLAEADRSGVTEDTGARSAADWVAVETRQTRVEARSELRLARALEEHGPLRDAHGHGWVNTAQARVIAAAVDLLPTTGDLAVTVEDRIDAEVWLIMQAQDHDATTLRVLGRRLFEVIAPDRADEIEGRLLEAEEQAAARRTTLTMREDDQGTCHGRFRIPARHGQMLAKMIHTLASPTRPDSPAADVDDAPLAVRHGVAFTELIERVPADSLPTAGGVGATVVVTMTLDQLVGRLEDAGVATLDTGGRISAAEARRLACGAGVIPAVLGGTSVPLDLGRERRYATKHQRIAAQLRDGHCTAQGCDAPPALCHLHHDVPWSESGATDQHNLRLLCGHHHRRVHDPAFRHERMPDGSVRFHRRE